MKRHSKLSWKQLTFLGCLLFTFAGLTAFLFGYQRDEKIFTQITSRLFAEEMQGNTLNMHYTLANPANFGIYDYDALLPVYSAEGNLASQASSENLLAALNKLRAQSLNPSDQYAYILLKRFLENSLALNDFTYFEEPLSPASGMQSQLPILLAEYAFRTKRDVEDYLSLLDQTDEYFASLLTFEQEKAAAGLLLSSSSLDKVKQQCDSILTEEELEAGTHFMQTTFRERLENLVEGQVITPEEADKYIIQNDRLLKTVLLPAYESLADGLFVLEDETIPLTGLAAHPGGADYYQHLLTAETGSYREIPEIKEMLLYKFKEELNAIQKLTQENPELASLLTNDISVTFPLQEPTAILADLQGRMTADFPGFPAPEGAESSASPLVTVRTVSPSLQPYCAPAFYLTAPLDDTDNNVIYINEKNSPDGLDLYTTLAHEGYPGHLYQTVYSNRSFLQNDENKLRHLLGYKGYQEGWALYVEFLAFDYAAELSEAQASHQDALLTRLEKHNRSLQLSLYGLLDIMIHYENASYSQVAAVLQNFGISRESSIHSIYSYIAEEPCNYLKYYLGYLEILDLKETARQLWGEDYTDYRFHRFFLDCGPSDFTSLGERLAAEAALPR